MNVSIPHQSVLKSLVRPGVGKETPHEVFSHFQTEIMGKVARNVFLPSLGEFTVPGKTRLTGDRDEGPAHPISENLQMPSYSRGIFVEEHLAGKTKDTPQKIYWGINARCDWELWRLFMKIDGDYWMAQHLECVVSNWSFSKLIGHRLMAEQAKCLPVAYDALYLQLQSLLKRRRDGIEEACQGLQQAEIVNWLLRAG